MIVFPPSTVLKPARRVPKEKIYLGRANVVELKRLFTDEVDRIVWANKLSAASLNLPPGGEVAEIEVFETVLTTKGVNPLVYKAIDAAVKPHNVLHLFTTADHFEVVFGYAQPGEKTSRYYAKSWASRDVAELALRGMTLDAMYLALMEQLRGSDAGSVRRSEAASVKEWREQDSRRVQLERQIAQLKIQRKAEKQTNRQFELAMKIRNLEKELGSIACA